MEFLRALRLHMFLACIVVLFVAGCSESDGPAEKAGKALDSAVESTTATVGDAMKSTGDAITGAAETAGEAVTEATGEAGDAMSGAMEKTAEEIKQAGATASEAVGLKD